MGDSRSKLPDLSDYELVRFTGKPPSLQPPARRELDVWLVVAGVVAVAATAIVLYMLFGSRRASVPVTTVPQSAGVPHAPVQPLGGKGASVVLPPIEETDPLVRDLVKQLTSHPQVAAWLTTDGLIRNFVVVVSNIAEGRTPTRQLRVLRPAAGFTVAERGGKLYIDPRSYQRYDGLAAAAASIDPAGAARLYATLKPRIEEAYGELGVPETPFDRTLERAIVLLLETPSVEDSGRAEPQGGVEYGFAAPEIEALPPAQKQLLRMGSRNVQTMRSSLRAIALALGIPAERLPAAGT